MKNNALQRAFVLHTRPFSETSLIADLFTQQEGRISVLAKGARRPRSRMRGYLQPFVPLLVDWLGKSELKTLTHVENEGPPNQLQRKSLLCGFYMNELLFKTLKPHDPHPELYAVYDRTLRLLQTGSQLAASLRIFEKRLLTELGYGLPLEREQNTGVSIQSGCYYRYHPQHGFAAAGVDESHSSNWLFSGSSLLALAHEQFIDAVSLRDAKRLLRLALQAVLGGKTLKTQELIL